MLNHTSWLRYLPHNIRRVDGLWSPQASFHVRDRRQDPEVEHAALQRSIQTLQSQIAVERRLRDAAEQETELTVRENRNLERQLALSEGCRARQTELEVEVEQLRLQWRADCARRLGVICVLTRLNVIYQASI